MKFVNKIAMYLVVFAMPATTFGMNHVRKGFGHACTAVGGLIGFSGPLTSAYLVAQQARDKHNEHPIAPDDVQKFAREALAQTPIKNPIQIKTFGTLSNIPGQATPNQIILSSEIISLLQTQKDLNFMLEKCKTDAGFIEMVKKDLPFITTLNWSYEQYDAFKQKAKEDPNARFEAIQILAEQKAKNDFSLKKFQAIIQHEGQHIAHNDLLNYPAVFATSPFIIYYGYQGISKYKNSAPKPTGVPSFGQSIKKIPQGYALSLTATLMTIAYIRHTEQRADDGIQNDKELLQSLYTYFKKLDNILLDYIRIMTGQDEVSDYQYHWYAFKTDPTHPTLRSRLAKLQERMDQLVAQEKNK